MPVVNVLLFPVSFVLESGPARLVTLGGEDGRPPTRKLRVDADSTARGLLESTLDRLIDRNDMSSAWVCDEVRRLGTQYVELAGVVRSEQAVDLVYTSTLPIPLAERELDIASSSSYSWRTLNQSLPRRSADGAPRQRTGADAIVLDFWRQSFEETDMALDFLPERLSLLQLRSLYDAVWGFEQDSSGFKRWAIDRTGALRTFLDAIDAAEVDESLFQSLGQRMSGSAAARAAAATANGIDGPVERSLALPVAIAAATSGNRLYRRRGPEPTWFRKSAAWRQGPTWIERVYPPRPDWTLWDTR